MRDGANVSTTFSFSVRPSHRWVYLCFSSQTTVLISERSNILLYCASVLYHIVRFPFPFWIYHDSEINGLIFFIFVYRIISINYLLYLYSYLCIQFLFSMSHYLIFAISHISSFMYFSYVIINAFICRTSCPCFVPLPHKMMESINL